MIIFRPKLFAARQDGTLSPSQAAANQRSQQATQRTQQVTQRSNQAEGMKQQRLNMQQQRLTQQQNLYMVRARQRQGMQNQRLAMQNKIANQRNLAKLQAAEKEAKAKNITLFKRPSAVVPPVPMKKLIR